MFCHIRSCRFFYISFTCKIIHWHFSFLVFKRFPISVNQGNMQLQPTKSTYCYFTTIRNYTTLKPTFMRSYCGCSFTTIRNYTTLKPLRNCPSLTLCFTTIRNYTTLKRGLSPSRSPLCFTTIRNYTTLKLYYWRSG